MSSGGKHDKTDQDLITSRKVHPIANNRQPAHLLIPPPETISYDHSGNFSPPNGVAFQSLSDLGRSCLWAVDHLLHKRLLGE